MNPQENIQWKKEEAVIAGFRGNLSFLFIDEVLVKLTFATRRDYYGKTLTTISAQN